MDTTARVPHAPAGTREILITWPDYDLEHDLLGRALTDEGLAVRVAPKLGARSPAELGALLAGAAGAIVSTDPFDAAVLTSAPELRVIARVGIGVDSVDLDAATAAGVVVTVTPGANEATVADHALAMTLALLRRLGEHDAGVRRGEWNRTGSHLPASLNGSTVGLVGFGRIGRLVADRLRGFDVRVLVHDPGREADPDVVAADLDELLGAADVISLHCPLLPTTRHLIGARELALVRPQAIVVNTARGGVIDEDALVDALEAGRLAGAALDVFEREPPRDARLLSLPNVLLSPHNAALSAQSVHEMTCRATASVIDVLAGRAPRDVANPGVIERLGLERCDG